MRATLVDVRAAAIRIVDQVISLWIWLANQPAAIAKQLAGGRDDPLCQLANRNLRPLGADVIRLAGMPLDQNLVIAGDRIGRIAEGARRLAVRVHHDVLS